MINKSITENNKKRPIIGRLICRNNQKQIPLASESKNEMEKGTYIPPMSHPWKTSAFKKQLEKAHTNHVYA